MSQHAAFVLQASPPSSGPEKNIALPAPEKGSITIPEIMERLHVGRRAVDELLRRGEIPAVRLRPNGKWIISRRAYEQWERTFGSAERGNSPRLA